ncbi:MAG: 50S ribosomal protein L7/L12 [Candidatus Moranbacteria bacterium GW2011_GWF2_36_839]|nr:MAG: 50S ribosomal protein L7/L12 [Candidatus Moranbacteria bacterium GW2011_GWF1_36_78]KKQ17344.1 MAG: 50S ribosomal protein L7/L12 [Candidatus Moranbacteria bacterium GW2011_GWF2_36_839]
MEEKDEKTNEKVQALREMIYSAEKTLQGAKSMLLQLEGKKKVGRRKKISDEDAEGGRVIEGTFDGQIMIGTDGKQYPVPANYASKSKLVEGDMLKLTITPDGSFIYKQIGPTDRKRVIGVANLDADGDYFVAAEGKAYKILLASITYFKVEPGDEVTLVLPKNIDSDWGSIENVLQKTASKKKEESNFSQKSIYEVLKEENKFEEKADDVEKNDAPTNTSASLIDEWAPDLEELKKELNNNLNSNS